jgi:hypothetical protein
MRLREQPLCTPSARGRKGEKRHEGDEALQICLNG